MREKSRRSLIVDSEKAVPLAIAANELIHNAIDHGFKDMEKGTLVVGTEIRGSDLHVYIRNDGHPLADDFSTKTFDLGLQIVRNLSEIELKGKFSLKNENHMVTADIDCPLSVMEG